MAYNGTRPADDDKLNISAGIIRDNFEGLRKDGIVIAKPPLYGAGIPPATLGEAGEQYFDTATGDQYLKTASGWTLTLSMAVKADQAALALKADQTALALKADKTALQSLEDVVAGLQSASDDTVQIFTDVSVDIDPLNGSVFFATVNPSFPYMSVWFRDNLPKEVYFVTLIVANGGTALINWYCGVGYPIEWHGGIAPLLATSGKDVISFFTFTRGATWFGAHWGSFQS